MSPIWNAHNFGVCNLFALDYSYWLCRLLVLDLSASWRTSKKKIILFYSISLFYLFYFKVSAINITYQNIEDEVETTFCVFDFSILQASCKSYTYNNSENVVYLNKNPKKGFCYLIEFIVYTLLISAALTIFFVPLLPTHGEHSMGHWTFIYRASFAQVVLSSARFHPALHCVRNIYLKKFCGCIALKYLNVISLTESTHSKKDVNRGFLVSFFFIPSGWQKKQPMGKGSALPTFVLRPLFVFTAVLWDHWFLALIIPCSCTVFLFRFKRRMQNVIYFLSRDVIFTVWNNVTVWK